MQLKEYLQNSFGDLGLSSEAAKVYYCILNAEGRADASYIKKQTGFSTATTYRILELLIEKGFIVSSIKRKPAVFTAIPLPELAGKFEARGRKFSRISSKLKELGALQKVPEDTELYMPEEVQNYYVDIAGRIDDFIWCVGSFKAVIETVGYDTEKDFIRTRVRGGHKSYSILFDDWDDARELASRDNLEKRETKFVINKNFPTQFTYLYGDTVVDFYKDAEGKVKVLKIDSPQRARAQLFQNQILWKMACGMDEDHLCCD